MIITFNKLLLIFGQDRKLKTLLSMAAFALIQGIACASLSLAHDFSGYVAAEGRFFLHDPLYPGQKKNNASLAIQPEYYHEWENGSSFIFVPFARIDSADSERTHFDIRELNYLWLNDLWELRVGIGKVFWGVTEFVHLVDIINQTDLVEDIDGEDKLGQPMINLSIPRDWGTIDMFVLPYFRERTYPGPNGRLRSSPVVDTGSPAYESSDEERHTDFAVRYSHSVGDWDFGVYNFNGTGREPTLLQSINESGEPVLIPFYHQINQTGIDLQAVKGSWLWKLETIYRIGQGDDFIAVEGGFEYSFVNMAQTGVDLGVIGEYAYDDRGDDATTPFQNDAFFGLRLALNDAASSELLAWFSQDLKNPSHTLGLEASRRFSDNWRLSIEARALIDPPEDDLLYSMRDDDFVRLEMAYYF
jgi:hypothetical protein